MRMGQAKELLNKVQHPEINNSLVELGMIGEIQEDGKKIVVELKLPMPNIPIKELLIDLIKNGLKGFEVEVKISQMDDEERTKFFALARQNWAL